MEIEFNGGSISFNRKSSHFVQIEFTTLIRVELTAERICLWTVEDLGNNYVVNPSQMDRHLIR